MIDVSIVISNLSCVVNIFFSFFFFLSFCIVLFVCVIVVIVL